jgi:hypothetical protein
VQRLGSAIGGSGDWGRRGYYEYRPKRRTCAACSLWQFCTRDQNGRTLKRYAGQELLDKARKQSHSPAADRKRRQWFQERNFAEATVQRGFKRARWRGQNLKITPEGHKTYLFVLGHKLLSSLCQIIRGTPLLLTPSYC